MKNNNFELKLKGKTCVLVDWANVYGWQGKKFSIDAEDIYKYFRKYKEVSEFRFYFGEDKTKPKSKEFLDKINKIGYKLVSKEVKFIKVYDDVGKNFVLKRKCDFDLEIGLDCFENLDTYNSFVFLSGDGDFATLYQRLIIRNKQVIVVYQPGHLGREIWEMKRGIFKIEVERLGLIKNVPPTMRSGGVIRSIITKKKKYGN